MKPYEARGFKITFLRLAVEEDKFFQEFNINPEEVTKECVLRHISAKQLMQEKRIEKKQYEAQSKMQHEREKFKGNQIQGKKQRKFKGEISIPRKCSKSVKSNVKRKAPKSMEHRKQNKFTKSEIKIREHDLFSSGPVKKLSEKKQYIPVCKKCSITLKRLSPDVIKKYENHEIAPKKCCVSLKRLSTEAIESYQNIRDENTHGDVLSAFLDFNDFQHSEAEQEDSDDFEWYDVFIYHHPFSSRTVQYFQKKFESSGATSDVQKRNENEDDIKLLHIVEYPAESLPARGKSRNNSIIIEEMEEDSDIEIIEKDNLKCYIEEPSDESQESYPGTSRNLSGKNNRCNL